MSAQTILIYNCTCTLNAHSYFYTIYTKIINNRKICLKCTCKKSEKEQKNYNKLLSQNKRKNSVFFVFLFRYL